MFWQFAISIKYVTMYMKLASEKTPTWFSVSFLFYEHWAIKIRARNLFSSDHLNSRTNTRFQKG